MDGGLMKKKQELEGFDDIKNLNSLSFFNGVFEQICG
jgi:hypothetical protein